MEFLIFIPLMILIAGFFAIKIVPQQETWIIERFGKYHQSIIAGLNFIIPFIDKVAYKHTLKERPIDVLEQAAITKDNVALLLDGILYVQIVNPVDASYGIENPYYAVTQLAQTSMRSAIGKISMDSTFEERELLNVQIVNAINEAAATWGIQCMRYEIRDIKPPSSVVKAMETQVAAERQKRAVILESEGRRQATINSAEAKKYEVVLNSEASMIEQVNRAKGEVEAIEMIANATAISITKVATAIQNDGGPDAAALKVAEQYIEAFKLLAKKNNTLIIPSNIGDVSAMLAQALSIFKVIKKP